MAALTVSAVVNLRETLAITALAWALLIRG
jgi:hypothetical protein